MSERCCDRVYVCQGDVECPVHGGFDTCCDQPDLHRPLPTEEQRQAAAKLRGWAEYDVIDDPDEAGYVLDLAASLAEAEARGHARGAAEAAALRERVEGLHQPIDPEGYPASNGIGYCRNDGFIWPCATARALDGEVR